MSLKSKTKSINTNELNVEAFSTIKTNIQYSSLNKSIKSIVVTSSNSKEGKSTVAYNLAKSFSQGDKKLILVDCDFRHPSVHEEFKISNTIGLSDILLGKHNLQDCLQSCEVKNLYILTCGNIPQNPSELFSSIAMTGFISKLKEVFDLIILDAPPILYFADSQILSAISDGTIIVSRYRKTDKDSLLKCKEVVDKVGGKIIGSIINDVPKKISSIYYKKYSKIK